tara:strand:+ start:1101 stop:1574 length:474 start_codon:yes stop_codon:yes gene_type:complete
MKSKVLDYIKYVLEVPRDEYNGMPTCPFAKKERESNNIYIDTINIKNDFIICMHKFIESGKNSAVFIQNFTTGERNTKKYQKFLNNILKELDKSEWKALCINPNDDLEVDGFNARSLAPCFMVLINNKKDIYYAHKSMKNTKYYNKMDSKYKKYLGL